jgi:hypothetical protein
MIYGLGFTLEKVAAMQEHGIKGRYSPTVRTQATNVFEVYFKGTWVSRITRI